MVKVAQEALALKGSVDKSEISIIPKGKKIAKKVKANEAIKAIIDLIPNEAVQYEGTATGGSEVRRRLHELLKAKVSGNGNGNHDPAP
jgi:DNA primase